MRQARIDQPVRTIALPWCVAAVLAAVMLASCASAQQTGRPSAPALGYPQTVSVTEGEHPPGGRPGHSVHIADSARPTIAQDAPWAVGRSNCYVRLR